MEYKMVTIPFDLETAKKINIGERVGQIVTEKGRNRAEIVYEDNSSICPLLVVIHSISVSADWFSATGKAFSSENRLLLEVPEYTTFKDGDVLSNKDGSCIFILNMHGEYLTSFYASLNQKGILKIEDGLSAWENQIEKYRFATESERQKLVDALKASKEPEAKEYLIEAKNWNIKDEKEVAYPRTGVPVFMLKDIGIGFRTIEGATEVANLLVKYNAFKTESKYLTGSYERFWIIKEGVCPAVKGETGYSEKEFDKIDEKNKNPELTSINTFNDTVKKANEIKDRVLKYVYNIKQERSYNNDMVGIFERYKDIADGDMEVAMNFIKEAYPFNEETEVFIRKKFNMSIPVEPEE